MIKRAGILRAGRLEETTEEDWNADEVALAALFLASDEASFITGVALPVDVGRTIL